MRFSCTCSLPDSLWCNRSAIVLSVQYILLGGNSTQCPTFELVCNDCQCQTQATVNLVMRSVLQTLYGLELRIYTYWLHQLCGPSFHCMPPRVNKELVFPYPKVEKNITPLSIAQVNCSSVDIVTIYMPEMRTAMSCSRWFWAILHIFWNCNRRRIHFPLVSRVCAFK